MARFPNSLAVALETSSCASGRRAVLCRNCNAEFQGSIASAPHASDHSRAYWRTAILGTRNSFRRVDSTAARDQVIRSALHGRSFLRTRNLEWSTRMSAGQLDTVAGASLAII